MTRSPTTIIAMPAAIARLPRDKHARPIPWFVLDTDDGPDFRVIRPNGISIAINGSLCWVCGTKRDIHAAFVIGPMCAVNRTTAEPPSHYACAVYSARVCPFLTTPNMRRRDTNLPPTREMAGEAILRNPGVVAVWRTQQWRPYRVPNGVLFEVGEPTAVSWWAHGRSATGDEVRTSVAEGLPILEAQTESARDRTLLSFQVRRAQEWLPR